MLVTGSNLFSIILSPFSITIRKKRRKSAIYAHVNHKGKFVMWVVMKTGLSTSYSNTKTEEIFYDSHLSRMVKISFRICPEFLVLFTSIYGTYEELRFDNKWHNYCTFCSTFKELT